MALLCRVASPEEERTVAGESVPAGTSGLLVIALDVLGQIVVYDVAYVWLVEAHAKGDRRTHDPDLVANEQLLVASALPRKEAGVVRARRDPRRAKLRRQLFCRITALHVDDAALVGTSRTPRQQLFAGVGFFEDGITQIGPVETCNEAARLPQLEKALDIVSHARRRRRRERQHRNVGVARTKGSDLAVLGPKVVTPFADAVRFVDRDAAQIPARQAGEKPRRDRALRSDIQQAVRTTIQRCQPMGGRRRIERAVEERCRNAVSLERVDLIFHQCDERRDNQREAWLE